MSGNDELLYYFQNELSYLRKSGAEYATRYPKVAGQLALAPEECTDPHIERLIESFAFLTGRLQHQIEAELPELTTALLGVLYPQLINPVPSMAIAEFAADPIQGAGTGKQTIPAESSLVTHTAEGLVCRFRTSYPVDIWPIQVSEAGLEAPDRYDCLDHVSNVTRVLRIRLKSLGDPIGSLGMQTLRFFIHGEPGMAGALYDMLFGQPVRVGLASETTGITFLPSQALTAVGFVAEESVLPAPVQAHPGYRLLQEYCVFPEKMYFFDLGLPPMPSVTDYVDCVFLLPEMPKRRLVVDRQTFRLGCTPMINLFSKISEPIRLDHRQTEYRLVPDSRLEQTCETYAVNKVSVSSHPGEDTQIFQPLFSVNHAMDDSDRHTFWHARRSLVGHEDRPGTELYLSFVDLNFRPSHPPVQTVYAHLLCSNRFLAEQIPPGGLLHLEGAAPKARISCLTRPTPHYNPPLGGRTLWKLVSHLSLNHLSLAEGKEGLHALREILTLYNPSNQAALHQQIMGMKSLTSRRVTRRIGREAWRGFCRGWELTLTVDEHCYVGSSPILFASVLNRFLALYASIDSFTQLQVCSTLREGIWKQWPPMAGAQILL